MRGPRVSLGLVPALGYLGVMLAVPLGLLVIYTFWRAEFFAVTRTFTLDNYARLATSPLFLGIIGRTLATSLLVAVVTVSVGYAIAYAITFRMKVWGPRILVLIMASLLSSYVVRLYALTTILGTNGILNMGLQGAGLIAAPLDFLLYGYPAIVIALTYVYLPIAVLPIYAAVQGIDPGLRDASRDLGLGPMATFLRVTLPLSARGLRLAFALTFILAASDYVAPRMVGGVQGQMIGAVIADQFGGASNYPFGATLAVAMVAGFGVVLGLARALEAALVAAWRRLPRPSSRAPALDLPLCEAVTLLALVFLFAPLVTVLVFSFNDAPNPGLPWAGFTGKWYGIVLQRPDFQRVLLTSLGIGAVAVAGSMLIGLPAALALARGRFRGRGVASAAILAPMAVPGVVVGVALLAAFVTLDVRLGARATAAAHVMLVLPFVVQIVRARLDAMEPDAEDAARDLGSRPLRVLRTVTLPILAPTLLGAGILAAAISLDELLVTNFIIGSDATVPTWISSQMKIGLSPQVNAVAMMMLVATLGVIGASTAALAWRARRQMAA